MKNWIILVLLFAIGLLVGWFGHRPEKEIVIKPAEIVKDLEKVDSLQVIIKKKNQEIDSLRENVRVVRETVIVKVKEVQKLELSESVELLKDNLLAYGELTEESDSLPSAISVDSVILLSQNNVKDVNSIVEKYKGELEVNEELGKIITSDSVIISSQVFQLALKDSIQSKKDEIYQENLRILEKSVKKSKNQTRTAIIIGGIVSALFLGLNFTR